MMLSDIIIQILKGGAKLRSKEIAQKASLLSGGDYISKDDIKREVFGKLKDIISYDSTTFQYYLISNKKQTEEIVKINEKEMIVNVIRCAGNPLSAIDISNDIKKKYKSNINYEKIELIILTELKYDIGIIKDRVIKYYLY